MVKIFNINSEKGGVTKTTTTRILANLMATDNHPKITTYDEQRTAHKVLVIDADYQCNLSFQMIPDYEYQEAGIFEAAISGDLVPYIKQAPYNENLYILPGSRKLASFDKIFTTELEHQAGSHLYMHNLIKHAVETLGIDIVIIDNAPGTGDMKRLLLNIGIGENLVILPIQLDSNSNLTLRSTYDTIKEAQELDNIGNQNLKLHKIVPVMSDLRTNNEKEILEDLRNGWAGPFMSEVVILRSNKFKELIDLPTFDDYNPINEEYAAERRLLKPYRQLLAEIL